MTTSTAISKEAVFTLAEIGTIADNVRSHSTFCSCCGVRGDRTQRLLEGRILSSPLSKWNTFGIIGTLDVSPAFIASIPDHRHKFAIPDTVDKWITLDWSKADRSLHDL